MFRKKSKQEAGRLSALSAFERLRLEDSDVDETSTTTSEYGPQPSEHAYTSSTSSTGESTILTPSSSGSTLRTSPFRSGSTMGSGRPLSSVFQSALSSSTLSSVPTRMSSMRSQSQQSTSSASTNSMYHKIIIGVDYGTTYTGKPAHQEILSSLLEISNTSLPANDINKLCRCQLCRNIWE